MLIIAMPSNTASVSSIVPDPPSSVQKVTRAMLTGTQPPQLPTPLITYQEPLDGAKHSARQRRGNGHPLILIVEDEPGLRMLLEKSLQKNNRRIIGAGNGQEALTLFANQSVDLVILDVMMPLMDGFETCAELRKLSDVPIIMLSAVSSAGAEAHALRQGVNAFLRKPVSLSALQLCVQSLLTKHSIPGVHPL